MRRIIISNDLPLTVPFEVINADLVIGCIDTGWPQENSERIVLVKGRQTTVLNNLGMLANHVRLRNPKQFLAFVRLRTSPSTFFMLQHSAVIELEIISRKMIDPILTFGSKSYDVATLRRYKNGFYGILDEEKIRSFRIPRPKISPFNGGTLIQRPVLIGKWMSESYDLAIAEEWVSPNGDWKYITRRPFPSQPVDWQIPFFK